MPVVVYTLPVVYAPPYAKFKFLGGHFSFRGGTFKFNYTRNTPPPPAITYIENVFSAYTYTGNGTSQTITNGINLSVDGGLVWIKDRTVSNNPVLNDTTNGIAAGFLLTPSTLGIQVTSPTPLSSFNSNGFSLNNYPYSNTSGNSNVSWTFRKAPKFFDIVQYTGNGTTQTIAHNLGIQPGMVVIKRTDSTGNWPVWHIGASSGNYLMLNTTAAQTATGAVNYFGNNTTTVDPNAIDFTVGNNADVNASGGTYIAYLYANDTSVNGLIQCGSASDTAGLTVTLGWEPQYILWKTSAITSNWMTFDTSRGQSNTSSFELDANTSGSDGNVGQGYLIPTATGFRVAVVGTGTSGTPMIYCAIRRGPMQQPTSGTQVYNAIARVGTGAIAQVTGVGFPPDLMISATRATWSLTPTWGDRLRGTSKYLLSANASSEIDEGTSAITSFNMDGVSLGNDSTTDHVTNGSGYSYINWFFRRYPGVFDEVAYTGDGTHSHAHNLGVIPEMVIEKSRSSTENWVVSLPSNKTYSYLNSTNAFANLGGLSSTATTFAPALDTPGTTYVAYLFASKPGVSKVGSYTGNGGTLNINANFTAPARFILIKRTDSTGDWYVWDSTRGLVAGSNNPHLSLNTTAAEVTTDDSVDPYVSGSSSGFTVKQNTATNINVSGGTYIYLAFQ